MVSKTFRTSRKPSKSISRMMIKLFEFSTALKTIYQHMKIGNKNQQQNFD